MSIQIQDNTRFPTFLIREDEQNKIGQHIMLSILRFANQEGGYSTAFGHRKKKQFMQKALDTLFDEHGVLNHINKPTIANFVLKFNDGQKLLDKIIV